VKGPGRVTEGRLTVEGGILPTEIERRVSLFLHLFAVTFMLAALAMTAPT